MTVSLIFVGHVDSLLNALSLGCYQTTDALYLNIQSAIHYPKDKRNGLWQDRTVAGAAGKCDPSMIRSRCLWHSHGANNMVEAFELPRSEPKGIRHTQGTLLPCHDIILVTLPSLIGRFVVPLIIPPKNEEIGLNAELA
jgi:hypothetical protein